MKLFDEYFRQRSDLVEASHTPRTVLFSHAGYSRAMKEAMPDSNHFDGAAGQPRTYCGLPYAIDPLATAELVVTHESVENVAQRIAAGRRFRQNAITVALSFDASKGQCLADGQPVGEPITMAEIVGSALTAAQLCDIIRAWLDADCHKWGAFEKGLDAVLEQHGRFE